MQAERVPVTNAKRKKALRIWPVKPFINLTLAGFVATSQNLTEVLSHLSFHVLLLAL